MPVIVAYPAFKNRATNPFQSLLYTEMRTLGWEVFDLDAGWRQIGRTDILHLHWPDGFVFHGSLVKTVWRSLLFFAMVIAFRLGGARIVWTIHNFQSHEGFHPRLETWFWRRFHRLLNGWVALNQFAADQVRSMPGLKDLPGRVIRHGLYPRTKPGAVPEMAGRREQTLLFFGKLRAYKEIPRLIETFEQWGDPEVGLVIAGQSHSAAMARFLDSKKEVPGLTLINRFIREDELAQLLESSDWVVIPYGKTLNSGVVFLALGYDKKLLAPRTPVLEEIQRDFGPVRIHLYDPPLGLEALRELAACPPSQEENEGSDAPTAAYTWPHLAVEHAEFFQAIRRRKKA